MVIVTRVEMIDRRESGRWNKNQLFLFHFLKFQFCFTFILNIKTKNIENAYGNVIIKTIIIIIN